MKITKKLTYYGFGVVLGLLAVNFFWDQKDIKMTYFPSSRILHDFGKKDLEFTHKSIEQLNAFSISKISVKNKIDDGTFDATLLDRDAKPCKTYSLKSEFNEKSYDFSFENCDSTVTLFNIIMLED